MVIKGKGKCEIGGRKKGGPPWLDARYCHFFDLVAVNAGNGDAESVICELLSFPGNMAETAENKAGDSFVFSLGQLEAKLLIGVVDRHTGIDLEGVLVDGDELIIVAAEPIANVNDELFQQHLGRHGAGSAAVFAHNDS